MGTMGRGYVLRTLLTVVKSFSQSEMQRQAGASARGGVWCGRRAGFGTQQFVVVFPEITSAPFYLYIYGTQVGGGAWRRPSG